VRAPLLLALLSLVAARELAAQARWPDERQAGQFLCHADFPLAPHEELLREVALLERDLTTLLGAPPVREPVHLFLFHDKTTYQAYLKQYFPRVPYRRALFIKARGPGMVFAFQGSEFEIDVRHESTHALLHAWLPSVPLWLDEGLAEYFEPPRAARFARHPHLADVQRLVRAGQTPRLAQLEGLSSLESMGREEYRDAWAWVHFLLHGPPEARYELLRYLDDLAAGGEPPRLSERLRRKMPDLERQIREHFRP
jgi:hypothetical protein